MNHRRRNPSITEIVAVARQLGKHQLAAILEMGGPVAESLAAEISAAVDVEDAPEAEPAVEEAPVASAAVAPDLIVRHDPTEGTTVQTRDRTWNDAIKGMRYPRFVWSGSRKAWYVQHTDLEGDALLQVIVAELLRRYPEGTRDEDDE